MAEVESDIGTVVLPISALRLVSAASRRRPARRRPLEVTRRVCSQCNSHTACHPWGDPAEWYCFHCATQWEVGEMTDDLQRVLLSARSRLRGAASESMGNATREVLQDTNILRLIIEFLETGLEDLRWVVAD